MSTTVKTAHPSSGRMRAILGWSDDDPATQSNVRESPSSERLTASEGGGLLAGGTVAVRPESPFVAADLAGLVAPIAARTRDQIREYNSALADIWSDLSAQGVMMIGSAASNVAQALPLEPIRVLMEAPGVVVEDFRRHCDFHSSTWTALNEIAFTISAILSDWREVFSDCHEVFRLFDEDDDSLPIGVSYTDRLGDYPPLAGDYEDVEVILGTEEDLEPRRYTAEDHQVWRP
jgi:hypothetical protein